ncbi:MAG: Ldh family oxidoreductase [Pseudolabrys sp.]|nr:Ldh family oxidoreductase [Pseudolabrys sp.]MDP2296153.1 Ldh family oxidoreductase [Pseudolabrys sp.]
MSTAAEIAKRLEETAGLRSIDAPDFVALLRDTFRYAGLSDADAAIAADVAAHGTLHGSDAHGAVQMPLYIAGLLDGTIKSQPDIQVTGTLPCCKVMDADHALGLVAGQRAMDAAIEMARTFGMGAVAVRRSSHNGTAGYFSERAAEHGLIGFAFTNAMPAIAPTGSTEALLGTNPIGAAFPLPGADPIVIDLATSIVARSRIRAMLTQGKQLPEGWALDPDGKPTTDPAVAVKGSVLPIGGPKGYALSLMVELLCSALSDAEPGFQVTYENMVKRPSNIGQFYMAINPAGFAGTEAYGARATHIADVLVKAKPMAGAEPPRLPGARGHAANRKAARDGLAITDNLASALKNTARIIESRPK